MEMKEDNCFKNGTIWDDLDSYLRTIEIYLKGEHCHEVNEIQQKEDYELYMEAIRLQKMISHERNT